MDLLMAFAVVLFILAILLFFKIDAEEIKNFTESMQPKPTLSKMAKKQKKSKLGRQLDEVILALKVTGQAGQIYYLFVFSFALAVVAILATIGLDNLFLLPTLVVCLFLAPFFYIRVQYLEYRTLLTNELETALSVVTSSYERTENIYQAFSENIDNINEPLQKVFREFLYSINHGSSIPTAIEKMKEEVHNDIFTEWCDNLKRCEVSRNMIPTLRPSINKITEMKVRATEAKTLLRNAKSEFIGVQVLSVIFMIINQWFLPFVFKTPLPQGIANFLFSADLLMIVLMSVRLYFLTNNIQFDAGGERKK